MNIVISSAESHHEKVWTKLLNSLSQLMYLNIFTSSLSDYFLAKLLLSDIKILLNF